VSDVVMPLLSGPELSRRLAASRPQMKVLFISGFSDEALAEAQMEMPGSALLRKPVPLDQLARAIRRVLDRR
jgi:two-component system, cell cycle sensor histidine kinase and response regulator CckA